MPRVEIAVRVTMCVAYLIVCGVAVAVLVPAFRHWLAYEAELAEYHLALVRWRLGSRPAPTWTADLDRDDLPEESKPDA